MNDMLSKKTILSRIVWVVAITLILSSCESCRRPTQTKVVEEQEPQYCQIVNIYVENSGSMKGYFSGNSQIKDVIKDYYDRIDDSQSEGDTITLNYINTQIENSSAEIKEYLMACQSKCTAAYSKIDDILRMAMEGINDSTVNIVISDYCFESDNSSIPMAMSGITGLFSKRLKTDAHLSVAIIKYMSDFNGKYFPGGIHVKKSMPFYLWIFGNEKQVKRIVYAPIKSSNCGTLILQPSQIIAPTIISKKARMVEDNSIIVSEWDKDRRRDATTYSTTIELNLSRIILTKEDLCNTNNYAITNGYRIESIEEKENGIYSYRVSTNKPSPGTITIEYIQLDLPEWVEKSNFTGAGIPKDSTTLGVKYLIGGVYDAYHNLSNKIFETKITLK